MAAVGCFLLMSGPAAELEVLRKVAATIAVKDVEEAHRVLTDLGAHIVAGPVATPEGRNLIAMHPDGTVYEYVDRGAPPTDAYLAGVDRALATPGDACERLVVTAEWTVSSARDNPLVRAMLTGCWSERLPSPTLSAVPSLSASPAQRRADGPLPSPSDLVTLVRDRAVAALSAPGTPNSATVEVARSCELVVRLALSCVTAPADEGGVADLVDALVRQTAPARAGALVGAL